MERRDGRLRATRIEKKAATTEVRITGTVTKLNATSFTPQNGPVRLSCARGVAVEGHSVPVDFAPLAARRLAPIVLTHTQQGLV